jgi:hypothetical protein
MADLAFFFCTAIFFAVSQILFAGGARRGRS